MRTYTFPNGGNGGSYLPQIAQSLIENSRQAVEHFVDLQVKVYGPITEAQKDELEVLVFKQSGGRKKLTLKKMS